MPNEIQNSTTDLLTNTIEQSFSFCFNCPLKKTCLYTKETYEETEKHIDAVFKQQLEKYNNQFSDTFQKEYIKICASEKYDKRREEMITKEFTKRIGMQTCLYEKQLSDTTIKSLLEKYDVHAYPEAVYIIEQIIKLRLQDLRLALVHKQFGMVRELTTLDGKHIGLKLTPGLHYSVEIASKIGTLVQQLHNMIEGQKINIEGQISIKEFMNKIIDISK